VFPRDKFDKPRRAPLLCYVTDRRSLGATESPEAHQALEGWEVLLRKIEAAAAAGVDWVQLREKDLSGKECSLLTHEALRLAASSTAGKSARVTPRSASKAVRVAAEPSRARIRTRILVNDRLDVALAMHADGVHLGEKSVPSQEARRLVNSLHREKDFLIGVSCHSFEAAKAAEQGGADYLFFGPVFATPSKAAYGAPQGLDRLTEVCRAVGLPVLAIGGITLENCAACLSAGASGIAAIRLFQDAKDISAVVRALRKTSA
jgi:thiamine-phosphate pyrophosphorylase